MWDVVIIGGGPAGLSAALMLGRCRRKVVVCDAGSPRNASAGGVHGLLTRDGLPPLDLLRAARAEVLRYGVELREAAVLKVARRDHQFEATLDTGDCLPSRRLLLATGVVDELPRVDGAQACFGRSLFHCPYCDGWEVKDRRLAVYGHGSRGVGLSLALLNWSHDIVLCTDGAARFKPGDRERFARYGIRVRTEHVARFEHDDGHVERVVFSSGDAEPCDAIFFNTGQHQRSPLAVQLGCEFNRRGAVKTDLLGTTCVPGLYVAGDASRDVQFVVVAAAEGAKVAFAINTDLQIEATR